MVEAIISHISAGLEALGIPRNSIQRVAADDGYPGKIGAIIQPLDASLVRSSRNELAGPDASQLSLWSGPIRLQVLLRASNGAQLEQLWQGLLLWLAKNPLVVGDRRNPIARAAAVRFIDESGYQLPANSVQLEISYGLDLLASHDWIPIEIEVEESLVVDVDT